MQTPEKQVRITRAIPGKLDLPNACVRVLSDGLSSSEAIRAFVSGADALVTMYTDRVDESLLDAAGDGLRIVNNFAVGYDNIDLEACKSRGIVVCNTPDAVTEGTANIAFLLMLSVARRLIQADRYARSEAYPANGQLGMADFMGLDLCGKELLIVGAGRIGYAMALRAKSLGMRIAYVARTRHLDFEMAPLAARRVELEEGLRDADVVSIHTPLTSQTKHLINADRLAMMKKDSILVNTSRGPVVDESALVDALESGHLWGAGLDVYEQEPTVHPGLIACDRAVLTPHIGSAEQRWREAMTEMVQTNISAVFAGEEPLTRVV
jgi:glyoxylate reductase|tara:strand:+ start:92027 stop:92995 length:969 start_codon:yes stop_codon:yes gene_type:complete